MHKQIYLILLLQSGKADVGRTAVVNFSLKDSRNREVALEYKCYLPPFGGLGKYDLRMNGSVMPHVAMHGNASTTASPEQPICILVEGGAPDEFGIVWYTVGRHTRRRFSQFMQLFELVCAAYQGSAVMLPRRPVCTLLRIQDTASIATRQKQLQSFVWQIFALPGACELPPIVAFFTEKEWWLRPAYAPQANPWVNTPRLW